MKKGADIAVVGMSCVFPGAKDLQSYWHNIVNKVDALQLAPINRIEPVYFDSAANSFDRISVNRGGFIDQYVDFDPIEFGIVPKTVQGTEPDQLLSLKMAYRALEDADVFKRKFSLQRAGIIIGRGNYGGVEMTMLAESVMGAEELVKILRVTMPHLSANEIQAVKKEYQKQCGNFGPDNIMGTVPNLVASLVANRLDFGGPAYTVDAACASSLIAIDHAVKELHSQRCDWVVAGAIHLAQNPVLLAVFSMLGALSKNNVVRPFDKRADGVLTGEGCGFVVLRRLEDAIKDEQRIYAVIKGVGVSSDGANASLMSPSTIGQLKAIRNAWSQTECRMEDVGYIEAHGTATPLGDKVEIETLRQAFGYNSTLARAGVGSVKSMIGHAMPAAGIAGFIKTTLALYHGKLPPTLHCEEPVDELANTRFTPVQEIIDWDQADVPKLAGVNAFGFGGANAHVVLEHFDSSLIQASKKIHAFNNANHSAVDEDEVIIMARENAETLIRDLQNGNYSHGEGTHRCAIFNPTSQRIEQAIKIIRTGSPWHQRLDIWYTNRPLLFEGKLAFIFPGLDHQALSSVEAGNFDELAAHFNLDNPLYTKHKTGIEVFLALDECSRLLNDALNRLNIQPDVVSGHSVGEWNACYAAGMIDKQTIKKLEDQILIKVFDEVESVFLSVGCGKEMINDFLSQHEGVYLSNDNCPHQVVVCGKPKDLEKLRLTLNEAQILNHILPFRTGYHSPFAAKYVEDVKFNLEHIIKFKNPIVPIWSGITAAPYPSSIKEVKQLHIDFMVQPVLFRDLTERLFDAGVRVFLQVGAGSATGFIQDTLKGKQMATITSGSNKISSLRQLKRVIAALYVEGRAVDLSFLNSKKPAKAKPKGLSRPLELGLRNIDLKDVLASVKIPQPGSGDHANRTTNMEIVSVFDHNMRLINQTQKDLLALLTKSRSDASEAKDIHADITKSSHVRSKFERQLTFSIEKYPELLDHCPYLKRNTTYDTCDEREPVVPLTMFIQIFAELAKEKEPFRIISSIENVNIYQFLWVKQAVTVTVTGEWKSEDKLHLAIDSYFNAEVVFANQSIDSDPTLTSVGEEISIPITASDIYRKGYMFHGPPYQCIRALTSIGDKGIKGVLVNRKGKGSLLDGVGQLMSLWYHLTDFNYNTFPVKVREIKFNGDVMDQRGEFECTGVLASATDEFIFSDIQLARQGKVWATIKGWQNRKSEVDVKLWNIIRDAESHLLAVEIAPSLFLFKKEYKRVNSWVIILNNYLNNAERRLYESMPSMKQTLWLMGRVAAKDAVRALLNDRGLKTHPGAIGILPDKMGRPVVEMDEFHNVQVSIAHKGEYALAMAADNSSCGVDIEIIKDRDASFTAMVLCEEEIKLLPSQNSEWITRCWTAKEAYGKSLGNGLGGDPRKYKIQKIEEETFWINDISIKTIKHQNTIISWKQLNQA